MYHFFFIHSSVHEHLDCFDVLAVVNSAVKNIGVQHMSFFRTGGRAQPSTDVGQGYTFLAKLPSNLL